jgi:PAS fold
MPKCESQIEAVEADGMLAEVLRNAVGLAIFDRQLRFRMINLYLAESNGTSCESHLGKQLQQILGDVALQVRPAIEHALLSHRPVMNLEIKGVLPTKPRGGHWIGSYFPIRDASGRVEHVGAVVVELGADVQLLSSQSSSSEDVVLRSWKDIARYVGTCVKTVQRWEIDHRFPVRRVIPNKGAVVFALRREVDGWLESQRMSRECPLSDDAHSVAYGFDQQHPRGLGIERRGQVTGKPYK